MPLHEKKSKEKEPHRQTRKGKHEIPKRLDDILVQHAPAEGRNQALPSAISDVNERGRHVLN